MQPALVAVGHGTADPAGRAAVQALVDAIAAALPEVPVVAGNVDVVEPTPEQAMAGLPSGSPRTIVPLLLSTGYHVRVDLTQAAHTAGAGLAAALGPDPALAAVLARRLRSAGLREDERVLLVAAGSSDPDAAESCRRQAELLAEELGRPVGTAFLTAARPRAADALRELHGRGARVAVASYLLAPGVFQRKAEALGAARVTPSLLLPDETPPELVDLALARYRAADASTP